MPLPQQFNPYIPQEELAKALAQYKQTPHQFSEEDVKALKDHAGYYNVPFAESEESNQGRIGGLISQIGKGFTEGFTTFDVFKGKPRDEYEAIARNIGHLAGFVGYIPAAPFKILGLKTLAGAAKYLNRFSSFSVIPFLGQSPHLKSIILISNLSISTIDLSKSLAWSP